MVDLNMGRHLFIYYMYKLMTQWVYLYLLATFEYNGCGCDLD